MLAAVTKISSNFPALRLYQNTNQPNIDIGRPPWMLVEEQNKPFLDVLVGMGESQAVRKSICLIARLERVPITIEKRRRFLLIY
ncbi:hypothetical protein [Microseira wollei]|uniref:Uncharacterized protein n=1 Tax=Microseira wollei NIES-4236 TaxID=2530354 RepID=A0AAV3WPU6_9CYAN|nr:hypothetical protein [Microseira wollei]GET44154.1 hypothetical protein MiSe_89800 [Microseira wollei NIES-4236]